MQNVAHIDEIIKSDPRADFPDIDKGKLTVVVKWLRDLKDDWTPLDTLVNGIICDTKFGGETQLNSLLSSHVCYQAIRIAMLAFPESRLCMPNWFCAALRRREEAELKRREYDLPVLAALISMADQPLTELPTEEEVRRTYNVHLSSSLRDIMKNRYFALSPGNPRNINTKFTEVLSWYVENSAKLAVSKQSARWNGLLKILQIGYAHIQLSDTKAFDKGKLEWMIFSEIFHKMAARVSLEHQLFLASTFHPNYVQPRDVH